MYLIKIQLVFIIFIFAAFPDYGNSTNPKFHNSENKIFNDAWNYILQRIEWTVGHIPHHRFPMLADNESGQWESSKNPKWTGGFWVGMLWLAYDNTGDTTYLKWAKAWNDAILGYEEEDNHDRGFVYYYSSVLGYKMTGNQLYFNSAIKAAQKLVKMSEKKSGMIPQNLNDRTNIIIDTMMNLPLLWWAYNHATESDSYKNSYKKIAILQSRKTLQDFIRPDGSTWQSVHFDTLDGHILKKHTHQGYSDSSCWSRGQSWGLYGFVEAYKATDNSIFLDGALKVGDYIITHLPEDGVPWYDYDDPGKKKDTSAGAIAAAGFLKLTEVLADQKKSMQYSQAASKILDGLIRYHLTPFVGAESPPGILQNGCYQIFNNSDSETIWGDYYFMEALSKILFN